MSWLPSDAIENDRLAALKSYHILDTLEEKDFDDLTTLAAAVCGVPIALISLVDDKRQWFKSHHGVPVSETPIEQSFCAHAIVSTADITIIEDAHEDERFKNNPLVTGEPNITFYAGVPLVNEEGFGLGTLCIIDPHKRSFSTGQQEALKIIARQVMDKLELRRKMMQLEANNQALQQSQIEIGELNNHLRLSDARLRSLILQAPVPLIVFKGDRLVIEAVNTQMLELLGKDMGIRDKPLLEAMPELTGQPAYEALYNVYTTGKTFHGYDTPVRLVRNGKEETGYYNFTYSPVLEDGKITGLIDMAVDVTMQVAAKKSVQLLNEELSTINKELTTSNEELNGLQHQLQKTIDKLTISEELQRIAIDQAKLGSWYLDVNTGSFLPSNRLKELFGYKAGEMMPQGAAVNQITEEYRENVVAAMNDSIANNTFYDISYPIIGFHDKTLRWVRATGQLYKDNLGHPTHFSGTMIDITEQKKDDERKNDFIGMVSHELKTPLTSLSAYLQILAGMAKDKDNAFAMNLTDKAGVQVDKMTTLINGFLNVSRLESGKIQIDKQPFDMATLVKEVEEDAIVTISTHILVFAPVEYTPVNVDRNKIGQVINNLLTNAVKYSPAGSIIHVACVTFHNRAQVSVRDEGMGIAQPDQEKLFDRYYRVENKNTKTISGFGIGLYLCSEIIQRHDGKIWVVSEAGKGSTFYFSLPVL